MRDKNTRQNLVSLSCCHCDVKWVKWLRRKLEWYHHPCFFILLLTCFVQSKAFAQTTQPGIVLEYKGEQQKTPLTKALQISVYNASTTVSDAQTGRFSLKFTNKKPGDELRFTKAPELTGYELYNAEVLNYWNISPNRDLNIVFCKSEFLAQLKAAWAEVYTKPIKTAYVQTKRELEKLRKENQISDEVHEAEIKALNEGYRQKLQDESFIMNSFLRVDTSEISRKEAVCVNLVKNGWKGDAIARYKELNVIDTIVSLCRKELKFRRDVRAIKEDIAPLTETLLRELSLLLNTHDNIYKERARILLETFMKEAPFDSRIHNRYMTLLESEGEFQTMFDVCNDIMARLSMSDMVSHCLLQNRLAISQLYLAYQLMPDEHAFETDSLSATLLQEKCDNMLKDAYKSSHETLKLAIPLYEQRHEFSDWQMMELYVWKGIISLCNHESKEAEESLMQAKKLADSLSHSMFAQAVIEYNLGHCSLQQGDTLNAVTHHLVCLKMVERSSEDIPEVETTLMSEFQQIDIDYLLFSYDVLDEPLSFLLYALRDIVYDADIWRIGSLIRWNDDMTHKALNAFGKIDINEIDWLPLYETKARLQCHVSDRFEQYKIFKEFEHDHPGYLLTVAEERPHDEELTYYVNYTNKKEKWLDYYITEADDKMGVVGRHGNVVIPNEYDFVYFIRDDNFAIVYKDDKCGVMNLQGDVVVPLCYEEIFESWGNYIIVSRKGESLILNDNGDIIFRTKNRVVSTITIEETDDKAEELLIVVKKNGYLGLANSKERTILPIKYDAIEPLYFDNSTLYVRQKGYAGLWDSRNRRFELPCTKYEDINCHPSGVGTMWCGEKTGFYGDHLSVKKNGKWGIINSCLEEVVPCNYDEIWEGNPWQLEKNGQTVEWYPDTNDDSKK